MTTNAKKIHRRNRRRTQRNAEPALPRRTRHEWRVTMPHLYEHGTAGRTSPAARTGHHVMAADPIAATLTLLATFAGDARAAQRVFDVQFCCPAPGEPQRVDLREVMRVTL